MLTLPNADPWIDHRLFLHAGPAMLTWQEGDDEPSAIVSAGGKIFTTPLVDAPVWLFRFIQLGDYRAEWYGGYVQVDVENVDDEND